MSDHLKKLYVDRLLDEFDGIEDWYHMIQCETDEKRMMMFITFIGEEEKHYHAIKELLEAEEGCIAKMFVHRMDEDVEEIMEDVMLYKTGKKSSSRH